MKRSYGSGLSKNLKGSQTGIDVLLKLFLSVSGAFALSFRAAIHWY